MAVTDWPAIVAAKQGPCRVHVQPASNGHHFGVVGFWRVVSPYDDGADTNDNIVPVCDRCRRLLAVSEPAAVRALLASLTDAEYAYLIAHGGADYPERHYGISYAR